MIQLCRQSSLIIHIRPKKKRLNNKVLNAEKVIHFTSLFWKKNSTFLKKFENVNSLSISN